MSTYDLKRYAEVWLPVPKRHTFTYEIPQDWPDLQPGQWVLAPLGKRRVTALVENMHRSPELVPPGVKVLAELLPQTFHLPPALYRVWRWAVRHYLAPPGEAMACFASKAWLAQTGSRATKRTPDAQSSAFKPLPTAHALNSEQREAYEEIKMSFETFQAFLLQGVTGSGKTEVYLEAAEQIFQKGKSTLILVPEISLTPQTLRRVSQRFGPDAVPYHSGLTDRQRAQVWARVRDPKPVLIIGTRSAVFLPFFTLGLIVVDEEHDPSYKQEERFRYHARDLAVMRAKEEKIPVVLGSATPSIESQENVRRRKYRLLTLHSRASADGLAPIRLIDLRSAAVDAETWLSQPLEIALQHTLQRGEQALLFLNRRGFAPCLLCRQCGEALRCANCDIALTYHLHPKRLLCHYCDETRDAPEHCPRCPRQSGELQALGMGTEKLEQALKTRFPQARLARLDRDTASSRLRSEEMLQRFAKNEIDILVGTQMVTKGHDFKNLSLVGILLADSTLNLPEFRAAERTFQQITQVAGRAGRHRLAGEVFLQTFRPHHYAIEAALDQNPEKFFMQERQHRMDAGYPPATRLVLFKLLGIQAGKVATAAKQLERQLSSVFKGEPKVEILGPAKAVLEKLRGKYRWQIMLRSPHFEKLRQRLEANLSSLEDLLPTGVQLQIDVDPVGLF